jgi:hypothetical protein
MLDNLTDMVPAAAKARVSIYQPEQDGLIFPEIPEFASVEEERDYRKIRNSTGRTRCACISRR